MLVNGHHNWQSKIAAAFHCSRSNSNGTIIK
jgi:hypothetical protein